jgi:hypothetical protein
LSYIKLTNGTPEIYSIGQLRRDNPKTSFPKSIPENVLADYDVYRVVEEAKPSFDPATQQVSQADPVIEDGAWVRKWTVTARPTDEIAAEVRLKRDALLAESDWVVTKAVEQNAQDGLGIQVPVVWLDYRQALRDIPEQDGFPENVTWPVAP